MTAITTDRLSYLREYLRERLQQDEAVSDDLFLDDDDNRIIWVSRASDELEVVVITLQAGKIEVAG